MKKNGLITNYRCLPYNPNLKKRSRDMRNNPTKSEEKFWNELLKNKKSGFQFYRQKPLYHYVADFYSAKLKMVVEIDGSSHDDKEEYDKNRDERLGGYDLKVIHYKNDDVLNRFNVVKEDFEKQIKIREKELSLIKE